MHMLAWNLRFMRIEYIQEINRQGEGLSVEFKEIGRADELGSGVRNIFKFCKKGF